MPHLHEQLAALVSEWRRNGYPCPEYPAIGEILEWATEADEQTLRFLRPPQMRALETYWYLRLIENTPPIADLYRKQFPESFALFAALGLDSPALNRIALQSGGVEALLRRIQSDDQFVRDFDLEAIRETLALAYPSYILALAMGAGKTILIGAIVATEFGMALEYGEASPFVHNALVFAPGTTIIESLRELAAIPYDKVLPPRFAKHFEASVKLTFTRDGEKTIPVIPKSIFNVVVTNTEKIRIQKETIRKADIGTIFGGRADEARAAVANQRLQAIASLPHLAIFSDEAHHTYGQSMDSGLKRVRQTVDYLAHQTNVVCVVNTTGTPYYRRQPLKDVVVWYGLSQGIRDNILKDVSDNIQSYAFDGDASRYVAHVIEDFFKDYGPVTLPNGARAKLAIYFPQTDDLKELKPIIDAALVKVGQSPTLCLTNTSDASITTKQDIEEFNRLNDPASERRVILLVNKGTEGWNCPSLFACALARKLKSSNNFVLQAASRCLRQVPGNTTKARIYLSEDNHRLLDTQLKETYGEGISDLNRAGRDNQRIRIKLVKADIQPLWVTQIVRRVERTADPATALALSRPVLDNGDTLTRTTYTPRGVIATSGVLAPVGVSATIATEGQITSVYALAADLADCYRLDLWPVLDELRRLYGAEGIPKTHIDDITRQVEAQTRSYSVREETVEVALALVKPEGFDKETINGAECFTAEIVYPIDRQHLILSASAAATTNPRGFGFHYDPYNFDSNPEKELFLQILAQLKLSPEDVEDVYFTGGITDPAKTDFRIEYKDTKGKWRFYTPDFVLRRKGAAGAKPGSGRVYIVEIKSERDRGDAINGETGSKAMAVRRWETLNPDRLKYELVFTASSGVSADAANGLRTWLAPPDAATTGISPA
jgi:type III restriction enzyme